MAIFWSKSSHLHKLMQKFNCSSFIVAHSIYGCALRWNLTQYTFRTLTIANYSMVIVTHSNNLSPVWHLQRTSEGGLLEISQLAARWAGRKHPKTVLFLLLLTVMHIWPAYPNSLVYFKYFLCFIVCISNSSLNIVWFILVHVILYFCYSCPYLYALVGEIKLIYIFIYLYLQCNVLAKWQSMLFAGLIWCYVQ